MMVLALVGCFKQSLEMKCWSKYGFGRRLYWFAFHESERRDSPWKCPRLIWLFLVRRICIFKLELVVSTLQLIPISSISSNIDTYLLDLARATTALCAYPSMLRKELRLSQRQLAAKEMSCLVSLVHSDGCQADPRLSNELLGKHELVITRLGKSASWQKFDHLMICNDLGWYTSSTISWFAMLQEAELGDMKHLQEAFGVGCLPWEIPHVFAHEKKIKLEFMSFILKLHFYWRILLLLSPSPSRSKLEEMRLLGGYRALGHRVCHHVSLKLHLETPGQNEPTGWCLATFEAFSANKLRIHLFLNLPTKNQCSLYWFLQMCIWEDGFVSNTSRTCALQSTVLAAKSQPFFDPGTWRLAAQCGVHVATERSGAWRPVETSWMHLSR